ncbi:cell division ATP-binding protein FtsE [Aureibacter tunicatorum]|uniref:Cell division ATP-binding protein FtsE n=1 Tax=Aureibacter tunicatorum TaxID=866807 RepID=A0AAE3XQS9_9BACT|nr:ATP-binding cassette domain-containing protein [Aureibacter tunicatorum]MDR6240353.1 cell division transport system ATP-binding protein [Aureibacter tunicatorum]BDD05766.1 phosphonate ABC transporter ATP-binding protein [Aureibacter tunicatorum]
MTFNSDPIVSFQEGAIFQNENKILENINFEISKGEFVYLVGRTGSGKSTLLKTLYADHSINVGKASVAGFDLTKIKRKQISSLRRKMGIVFQDFQLFDDRTVAENLEFVMRATGWKDRSKIKTRIAELTMDVGLSTKCDSFPFQLSGGEQQRVSIARALVNYPQIMIADEPTGNLDPEVSEEIYELFESINRKGTAILMATHAYSMIEKHPARILLCESQTIKQTSIESLAR